MTYRERGERRAERLREWAAKRAVRSEAAFDRAHDIAGQIPLGQPVLVGHHSKRRHRRDLARIDGAMEAGVEHSRKADEMSQRADNIKAALEASIYEDDADAIERLRERIAALEAERERIKAYNASCRRGQPDPSLLDERQRETLESVRRVSPFALGKSGAFPGYALSNLNGNLARTRQRLARLLGEVGREGERRGSCGPVEGGR
jgi:uncharacterized small protein (DUF1192 family)